MIRLLQFLPHLVVNAGRMGLVEDCHTWYGPSYFGKGRSCKDYHTCLRFMPLLLFIGDQRE